MKYCTYCGQEYPDDAEVCPVDGKPLDRAKQAPVPEPVPAGPRSQEVVPLPTRHVTLSLMIVVVLRIQCLLLPIQFLPLYLESISRSSSYGGRPAFGIGLLVLTGILAVGLWQLAPWLAELLLGKRDVAVPMTGLTLEDLYCSAFVLLGLYFVLRSLAPMLMWAHYSFLVAARSSGAGYEHSSSLYELLGPTITVAAGLVCIFKGPKWAGKLVRMEGRMKKGE